MDGLNAYDSSSSEEEEDYSTTNNGPPCCFELPPPVLSDTSLAVWNVNYLARHTPVSPLLSVKEFERIHAIVEKEERARLEAEQEATRQQQP